jgi:glucosylglycerate synthase
MEVDVDRMLEAFRQGARDLTAIWELILAPDTLAEVLALDTGGRFRFPDDLWARVVYDFALGHHYSVVHRDHLLRSLTPLYLGRTAAFVLATRTAGVEATLAHLDAVAAAFERQKTYLVEHWR